jgi:SAM-dependent methyltransferase
MTEFHPIQPATVDTCKVCGSEAKLLFGLPSSKMSGHPIPAQPDDCWYYGCTHCDFCFTRGLDAQDHAILYDEGYWNGQDPDWYGRVSETLRLVALANELRGGHLPQLEVLDFGCGIGGFVEIARKHLGLQAWGTDIIPPKVGGEWFLPDLGDRKFDIIVACEVIEHLPDPRATFEKIRAHLKSPGVFAFQTAQWDPQVLDRDWWYLGPGNGHISMYSPGAFTHLADTLKVADRTSWNGYAGVQAWLFKDAPTGWRRLFSR